MPKLLSNSPPRPLETNMNSKPTRYDLIDCQTGKAVKSYTNRDAATRAADAKDMAYGAVRFIVQPAWADEVAA